MASKDIKYTAVVFFDNGDHYSDYPLNAGTPCSLLHARQRIEQIQTMGLWLNSDSRTWVPASRIHHVELRTEFEMNQRDW